MLLAAELIPRLCIMFSLVGREQRVGYAKVFDKMLRRNLKLLFCSVVSKHSSSTGIQSITLYH